MAFDPEAARAFERAGFDPAAMAYETAFASATSCFIPRLLDAAVRNFGVHGVPRPGLALAGARDGTARHAAMLAAQPADRMPAIEAGLTAATAPWWDGEGLAVPIACVIAYGTRP